MTKGENTEGGIFDLDYSNFNISLNRESLHEIKKGGKIESIIFHNSYLFKTKEDLQERMKKELIIGLTHDDIKEGGEEVIIEPYGNTSNKVIINISNNLLENLINYEGDCYEYCLNSRGNKMNFYVNNSTDKKELNNKIEELKIKYSKK